MTVLVQAEHLSRYYGSHCAVDDVSFSLNQGEVLGLLGPNGAGKTSTMQMLCGNLAPSTGRIRINGIDLLDRPKEAKRHLGYLPDTPPLYRELTVREFLIYCAALHDVEKNHSAAAVSRALERCGLTEVSARLIGNLSKGFQQRIGIAQAILHNPKVIILDEPTVGLDPLQIREIRALIRELGREHGIILSTHILTEVEESCTHVHIIQQGRLILNETIAGLQRHMHSCTLELITRLPPDINIISALPGVLSVETLAENRLLIHHGVRENPAKHIAELIVASGWGLEELTPIKKSLEDVFIQLTRDSGEAQ
ncbi:MAG: ABC transporter ATP-binding protein [Gammaproteobacteria bacterium]